MVRNPALIELASVPPSRMMLGDAVQKSGQCNPPGSYLSVRVVPRFNGRHSHIQNGPLFRYLRDIFPGLNGDNCELHSGRPHLNGCGIGDVTQRVNDRVSLSRLGTGRWHVREREGMAGHFASTSYIAIMLTFAAAVVF